VFAGKVTFTFLLLLVLFSEELCTFYSSNFFGSYFYFVAE